MFVEIPARRFAVALQGRPLVIWVRRVAANSDSLGHGKIDAIIDLAEILGLGRTVIFLIAEIPAWHTQHHQPAIAILFPQRLQGFILGCKTAQRGGIHQQDGLAGEICQ